ncbi:transporter [Bartonella alsatica]|uniref:VirB4 family type IV secretion/conjugal transfer ATPase n=2 Tax=Bartonella alsatica TaxID=52764 RepID=J0YNM4_9HYPH|nr:transporter [Bartonella alsatica]EJF76258.1 VirB4 family type IV secretion/conjugal transfer ATPase [Bartonella alsatica IBS 382]QLC51797.1 transporter [Bartonella alsatica]
MLKLKHFRSTLAGLPDLLNFAALIDDGIILGKDGSLLAGFFIRGDDPMSATDTERNYITGLVNTYLSRFYSGWAIWVDAIRVESPGYSDPRLSHFPDPITALIDAERRFYFKRSETHYETEYALLIQYLPPTRKSSKLGEIVYEDDTVETTTPAERLLDEFKKKIEDFYVGLGDLLKMQRMKAVTIKNGDETYKSDQLVNYLHYAINGEAVALRIPDCPMYLDSWLGYTDLWPGDTPRLGGKFIACISIDGFPTASYPGILDILDGLPLHYRWSSRFIFMDQHEAVAALNKYRLKWQQKVRGFFSQVFKTNKGTINTDALLMAQQAEAAMNEARSGLVAYGYYSPTVVLMHENREVLAENARLIKREIEHKGFAARIETVNTMEAWLGTIAGQTYPNIRRPLINTQNLADMLPLSSVWPGLQYNPCPLYPDNSPALSQVVTTGATAFRINLHVDDVGHTLVFGPTGAGKSTLLAFLLAQARRYWSKATDKNGKHLPANITAFDKGHSLYTLCYAVNGRHYDIGESDSAIGALMPLADIDTEADNLWAQEWIATCYELQTGKAPSPQQKIEIHRAMKQMRQTPKNMRSLGNFVTTVQDKEIRQALMHYTLSGGMGYLLDGQEPLEENNDFIVYEIDELMKLGDKNGLPVLLYLFRRFERGLKGQPSILSLDEAWIMLGHSVFREKIREWLKELRKKNCLVIMATQSLSDASRSGILDVLLEQCPTKILLPNEEAETKGAEGVPGAVDLYRMIGLNDKEIQIIKTAKKKRQYYYKSILGRRLFELGLGDLALSFVAISSKEDLAEVKKLINENTQNWPLKWLKMRGVHYEQYLEKT